MKAASNAMLVLATIGGLLACNPLDKKYDKATWFDDVATFSESAKTDSLNQQYVLMAVTVNEESGKSSEEFTLRELLAQGEKLHAQEKLKMRGDSLLDAVDSVRVKSGKKPLQAP